MLKQISQCTRREIFVCVSIAATILFMACDQISTPSFVDRFYAVRHWCDAYFIYKILSHCDFATIYCRFSYSQKMRTAFGRRWNDIEYGASQEWIMRWLFHQLLPIYWSFIYCRFIYYFIIAINLHVLRESKTDCVWERKREERERRRGISTSEWQTFWAIIYTNDANNIFSA